MSNISDKLQALYLNYKQNLPAKIDFIDSQWQALDADWTPERLHDFHREVHSLCGSSAIYGYDKLSAAARELEIYLKELDDLSKPRSAEIVATISPMLAKFREMASLEPKKEILELPVEEIIVPVKRDSHTKLIYIVDADTKFVLQITQHLAEAGYSILEFKDLASLKETVVEGEDVVAMIVDVEQMDRADINRLVRIRKNQQFTMPLICVAQGSDLITRLKAVRSGASAFLPKPVEMFQLTKLLGQDSEAGADASYRILIIDDTASLAEYYSLILQQAGMITHLITNPLKVMEILSEFQPDLLLMDIYMPECSGLELAAVLRQDPLYTGLPIIFLSTEDDKLKQLAAMSLGGDDFLTKPVQPQHLVAAVRARAKRAGILSSYMIRDSLTQLLNHNTIVQDLENELTRAAKHSQPLSFIIIDIDHFKDINDTYGHLMGDYVLRKLSELLLSHSRKTDMVGRYGGEEFALVFPGMNAEQSIKTCNDIREQFAKLQFKSGGEEFFVTFSAGIASFPQVSETEKVIAAADKALYKAKHFGRNRVVHSEDN
jgi:diguanylate cyclase (GGDEF)-like protein